MVPRRLSRQHNGREIRGLAPSDPVEPRLRRAEMAPYHTPPLQRPRRCVVFSLVVAAVCSLGHGAGGNTVNMGPAVGHAEAPQPGDALAPAPAPTPAADPNAPLSNRVAMMVCYQFIVKALMATDSKEEPEVADCLVQIHEL